jgi:hypothetical protein
MLGGAASPTVLHADWHAALMGQDRPVLSVFTFPSTHNDVSSLPTAVGFRRMLSMHVLGVGHETFLAGDACHTLIPDDSGPVLCTPLTAPS